MATKLPSHTKKSAQAAGSSPRVAPAKPNAPHITRISRNQMNDLPRGKTDWERLRNLSDEDIAKSIANDPDTVPLDLDWSDAELVLPSRKKAVSIRLDEDVLNFFKETGSRYQTRINEVLRSYMKAQRRKSEKV